RLPHESEIIVGEAGLRGEMRIDEAVRFVQRVRHQSLLSDLGNFTALSLAIVALYHLRVLRVGNGHTGDAQIQRNNRIDAARESELDWASNLPGIDARAHNRAKRAYVEEVLTHPVAGTVHVSAELLGASRLQVQGRIG